MNAQDVEGAPLVSVPEQAREVSALLKEYAAKLTALNTELLDFRFGSDPLSRVAQRVAWLLDRGELLRNPLANLISRGSALLSYPALDGLAEDELTLRMREIEIHWHHMLRLTHELRQSIEAAKMLDLVNTLRVAAGLSGMKGGPLKPE